MQASFINSAGWRDVFQEILDHLEPLDANYDVDGDNDGKIYLSALRTCRSARLSLALSCRAFLDPSLNRLWRNLDDIQPLLMLLPNYQRRDSTYHLTGEISSAAWARLGTYATRVRTISVWQDASIDPSVWQTILKKSQGTVLLPNLRTLNTKLRHATPDNLSPIHRLASPSLRHLFISVDTDRDADDTMIANLLGLTLQEFSMKSPGLVWLLFFPYMTIGREHLTYLSRFTKMERLNLSDYTPLDENILLSLANLQNLTHLQAYIQFQDSMKPTHGTLDVKDGFQKLARLDVRCQPTHLARFMLASSMPRLHDLRLRLRSHSADDFLSSFPAVFQHIGPHTLTQLLVELGDFIHPPPPLMVLLESVLPFANLEQVEFFLEEPLPLRDEDLERLSRAWPGLHTLVLAQSETALSDPDHVPGSVARPTLHGLVALARGCPQLAQLCILDLDATSMPPADRVPLLAHGARNLCIQNLVGAENDETQLAVAVVLDRLFPRLKLKPCGIEELPDYGENPNPYRGDSQNVSLLLRAMQAARRHYPGGFA
ncbi:hypothetical protein V8D89_001120 [Ganoderma adspersum]